MSDDFWFRTLFKLKIYETSGESFQKLFQDIMSYRYSDFQSIAPYGNWGDGGNDGWTPSENRYFQVFGKKATSKSKKKSTKVSDDFEKLRKKWANIERYHFVYNDRFEGIPATISKELAELKNKFNLTEASPVGSRELERFFMELTKDQREAIIGGVPAELPDFIDPRAIGEVLRHLADKVSPMITPLTDSVPDIDEKICLNNLTYPIHDYIRIYFHQTKEIDDFLDKHEIGLKQAVAEEMRRLYKESCEIIPSADQEAPNLRYVWMAEQLIPPSGRNHPHTFKAYREAAQVILAKYFESCDVYEHPKYFTAT